MVFEGENMEQWIYYEKPTVGFAGSTFFNIPIILKIDDYPLIQVVDAEQNSIPAGYTVEFEIYNSDGIYLAKAKGSRLFLTSEGEKVNLKLRYPSLMTVCELDGRTLFEMRRQEAAALNTRAELYTPNGSFIKGNDTEGLLFSETLTCVEPALVNNSFLENKEFKDKMIGIQMMSSTSS